MKFTELRVGNLVMFNGSIRPITTNNLCDMEFHTDATRPYCKPIPITEEILLNCGFEFDDDWAGVSIWAEHNKLILLDPDEILDNTFDVRIEYYEEKENCIMLDGIKYLHQLQNLYFTLTGKELNITL